MESLQARMARIIQFRKLLIFGMVAALWSVLGLNAERLTSLQAQFPGNTLFPQEISRLQAAR
jgi:hypothetical protein